MKKEAFTEKEAAEYIGMSQSFLRQDRMNGFRINRTQGPPYVRVNRTIRYPKANLDAWLQANLVKREMPIELLEIQDEVQANE